MVPTANGWANITGLDPLMVHKILLLGANGQLGHQLVNELEQLGEVKALTRSEADLSKPMALRQALTDVAASDFRPTVIVNAAAYTAVDKAQTEAELAHAVNAASPAVLAELAHAWNATLVHYSTDYVFDGSGAKPWQENDPTHPLSVYGQSKRDGELAIVAFCHKHLILRTSWVVGVHGGNFLKTMLRLAAEQNTLRVVDDQMGAPTSTELLADVTVKMLQAMSHAADNDTRWGIYHVAAAGEVSWHGYAQHVIGGALRRGAQFKVSPETINPIVTAEYPLPAPRPLNSRLNTHKLQTTFGIVLPAWQVGVDAILDQLISTRTI
mgnify:CR=1 FL=1